MHESNTLMVVAVRPPWQIDVFILVGFAIILGGAFLKRIWQGNSRGNRATGLNLQGVHLDRRPLLTPGEHAFIFALDRATANRYRIAMKVRLGDLVHVSGKMSPATSMRNRVNQKHVDFVVCSLDPVEALLAIELDDKSHDLRPERDLLVDQCLGSAGLPILHVPCKQAYDVAQLRGEIDQMLGAN
jgi:hypothetical protein